VPSPGSDRIPTRGCTTNAVITAVSGLGGIAVLSSYLISGAEQRMMVEYRRAIFAKVVLSLVYVGLMTDRVRNGFDALNLPGSASARIGRARDD
jgi:hypothetical protein